MMSVNSANSDYASSAQAAAVKTVSAPPPSSSAVQTQAELPPPSYNPSVLITLTLEAQAYLALTQR